MVQLLVRKIEGMKEWVIVELQGELVSRYNNGMAGNILGDLHISKSGEPILIVGHHILHGKVADLEKPYGVMVKADKSELMQTDEDFEGIDQTYHIKAIIKRKIIFKNRPKPIITHVPKRI